MKRKNHWMMRLFILSFSISISVAIVPCGVVNVYGVLGEIYSSVAIETENETLQVKTEVFKARKEKGINIFNIWCILWVMVVYISYVEYVIHLPRGDTIVTLKVRMDN